MKSTSPKKAVDDIAELIGAEFSEEHLYLESNVTSNTRLQLNVSKVGDSVEVNRIPPTFFWAHILMLSAGIPFSVYGFQAAQRGDLGTCSE
jgi:hypothetical protein